MFERSENLDLSFCYINNSIFEDCDFDTNRWNECVPGIHHFLTRKEAENYL